MSKSHNKTRRHSRTRSRRSRSTQPQPHTPAAEVDVSALAPHSTEQRKATAAAVSFHTAVERVPPSAARLLVANTPRDASVLSAVKANRAAAAAKLVNPIFI